MVQFEDIRNRLEPFLEVSNLLERITEFHNRSLIEHSVGVHDEFAVLEGVEIGGNEKKIRG